MAIQILGFIVFVFAGALVLGGSPTLGLFLGLGGFQLMKG